MELEDFIIERREAGVLKKSFGSLTHPGFCWGESGVLRRMSVRDILFEKLTEYNGAGRLYYKEEKRSGCIEKSFGSLTHP